MTSHQIFNLVKWKVMKLKFGKSSWWNEKSEKQVDEMTSWWNVKSVKQPGTDQSMDFEFHTKHIFLSSNYMSGVEWRPKVAQAVKPL